MKKQFVRIVRANPAGKFFKAAALAVVLSGAGYCANAQVTQVSAKVENDGNGAKNTEITALGSTNGMLLFEVKVANASGGRFRVIVKEVDGSVLFQNSYDDKNFAKKFMIPRPDSDKLIFIVKSASGNSSQSFEINSTTRIVEDVVVTKI